MDNNKKAYTATRASLVAQLDLAKAVVKLLNTTWEQVNAPIMEECLGETWNSAHAAVPELEYEIRILDREWDARKLDPTTRRFVSANVD